jgi:hypothetical protein
MLTLIPFLTCRVGTDLLDSEPMPSLTDVDGVVICVLAGNVNLGILSSCFEALHRSRMGGKGEWAEGEEGCVFTVMCCK